MAERRLGRTIDKAMGVAGPLLGKVALLFEQQQGAGLAASIASPAVQRGMGELAGQQRAAEQARHLDIEMERQRERERQRARKRDFDMPDM